MIEVFVEDPEFERADSARTDVLVSRIEPRQASRIVKDLSCLLPLEQAKLTHLKRIRCSTLAGGERVLEVLLSLPDIYNGLGDIERRELEGKYNLKPTLRPVPELEPRTRQQFERGQSAWPMIFHHSTSEEARRAARVISEDDIERAKTFMRVALEDARRNRQLAGGKVMVGAIMVDPATNRVVASASSQRRKRMCASAPVVHHPLDHPTMLCIDGVAQALLAGRGEAEGVDGIKLTKMEGMEGGMDMEAETRGTRVEAEVSGGGSEVAIEGGIEGVKALGTEQYLCTGFDLYITEEPCLMCAMALVHSRIRRVIYGVRDPKRGCLGSLTMLHTLASLNHNYRVFEGVCAEECQRSMAQDQDQDQDDDDEN